jgi:thiol-disulfide isomerase/thioredoxin
MFAELLTSVRRSKLRFLPVVFIFIVTNVAVAQDKIDYCELSPAVKEDLKTVDKLLDEDLPFQVRRQRQLVLLQELVKKHPADFHVQRRYLDTRMSGFSADRDALIAEYRAQMEKNPNDPVAVYLYTRLLVGRRTKEAIQLATKVTQESPEFPWPHYQLAEIYSYPNFRDPAKLKEHLKVWSEKCPTNLTAIGLISRFGDKETMSSAAQRLRARLESSTNNDDLGYWDQLWTLEFKLRTVPEHAKQRELIAEDVKRIRARNLNTQQWLDALKAGYKQAGDKEGERWAIDELMRLLPKSSLARRTIQGRFFEEHPYPKSEATEEQKQAYHRAVVEVTNEWTKRWPDDEYTWSSRVRSLMALKGASNEEVETAYIAYAKAHERGGTSYSIPPLEVSVARFYLKQNFHVAKVPDMLLKGFSEIERIEKSGGASDLYPRPAGADEGGNLKYMRLDGWPLLAEAYARLKQPEKAQAVLAQLADVALPKKSSESMDDRQKRSAAYNQTVYWQAVGKVAEIEQRKLDAMTAYQTALSFRLRPAGKEDELTGNTQRLWKELGGTDQGWKAYLARNEASKSKIATAETAAWDSKNTALPEFDLTDLEGRKWTLANLKGKVAFINFWATWCGPCREELPYVQKLREQLKDRKDVIVLTLNTDEEIGKVEPFMKENKFTFPVLLGQAYADSQGINSIPRNWIVSLDGKLMFEGIGFGSEGDEWMKKATQLIEKVKGSN